jgi:hypothetical protein
MNPNAMEENTPAVYGSRAPYNRKKVFMERKKKTRNLRLKYGTQYVSAMRNRVKSRATSAAKAKKTMKKSVRLPASFAVRKSTRQVKAPQKYEPNVIRRSTTARKSRKPIQLAKKEENALSKLFKNFGF